ncbi:MAG: hypothetical protein ABSG38_16150 [Spirochaetia bacterium]
MSKKAQFRSAIVSLRRLRKILEPEGGVISWQDQPREQVREFLRAASNAQWLLGIAVEDIILSVGIKLPRGIEV